MLHTCYVVGFFFNSMVARDDLSLKSRFGEENGAVGGTFSLVPQFPLMMEIMIPTFVEHSRFPWSKVLY